jgi:hypothetical protein
VKPLSAELAAERRKNGIVKAKNRGLLCHHRTLCLVQSSVSVSLVQDQYNWFMERMQKIGRLAWCSSASMGAIGLASLTSF